MSTERSALQTIERHLAELQLQQRMQRDLRMSRSFDRLIHVALRLLAPFFDLTHAVVFVRERNSKLRVVHQIGSREWDTARVLEVFETGRSDFPENVLYVPLRERNKVVGLMLAERSSPFSRLELRSLFRFTATLNEALDALAESRTLEVLSRIDRKISRQLRTSDLLYQILDALVLLVRYDHSASVLLLDTERSQFIVRAEKIVWQKMKSANVQRTVQLDSGISSLLHFSGCGFLVRKHARGLNSATFPLFHAERDPSQGSAAALRSLFFKLCSVCESATEPEEKSMVIVPLLFGNRPLGLIKLGSRKENGLSPADILIVGRFVEKMATAIRNASLYEHRLEELQAINEIGKLVTRQIPLPETCSRILEIVLRVMNLKVGSIELLDRDQDRLRIIAAIGYASDHEGLALGHGLTGEVALTGALILANDVRQHEKYVREFEGICSELAIPITFEGETLGVLNVESYTRNRFSQSDVDFLSILADKTATALETLTQRDRRRATLQLLYDLSRQLSVLDDLQRVLDLTVKMTRNNLSCEVASIFLFEDGKYRRRATSGLPSEWFPDESYRTGEGLTGRAAVLSAGSYPAPVLANDIENSGEVLSEVQAKYIEKLSTGRIAHLIAVPLVEHDRPIGVLRIINRVTPQGKVSSPGFTPGDMTVLSTIASQASLAIADFRKRERIHQLGAQLETQVQERTEEAHRLATFVENAPLAIFSMQSSGELDFINEAGERMFGYQAEELIGKPLSKETLPFVEGIGDLKNIVEFMSRWSGEVLCHRANASTFPAFLSASALTNTSGENQGIVFFARDLTSTKELEKQLLKSEGKRAMADLAGGVAHDLNNALGSCLPLIQALKEDLRVGLIDRDQFKEDLDLIEGYTRLSVRIFKGMLAMARGTFAIDQRVGINTPLETALALLSFRLEKTHVEIVRELEDGLPRLLAHPGRLEQAFHNVITNAIDAMPTGGTLRLRTRQEHTDIVVEIIDSGAGIPPELLERVEEPFYTSKRHGTGLGLSVVRSIVWEHKGKMRLTSEEGHGTQVTLRFPIPADFDQAKENGPCNDKDAT